MPLHPPQRLAVKNRVSPAGACLPVLNDELWLKRQEKPFRKSYGYIDGSLFIVKTSKNLVIKTVYIHCYCVCTVTPAEHPFKAGARPLSCVCTKHAYRVLVVRPDTVSELVKLASNGTGAAATVDLIPLAKSAGHTPPDGTHTAWNDNPAYDVPLYVKATELVVTDADCSATA